MNETRLPSKTIIGHLMLSGVMLGCAFPPLELGPLAFAACIPLLFVFERESGYGRILRGSYLWLFVVHCITVYWTGGFTHGKDTYLMLAGAALLIFHPGASGDALCAPEWGRRPEVGI